MVQAAANDGRAFVCSLAVAVDEGGIIYCRIAVNEQ